MPTRDRATLRSSTHVLPRTIRKYIYGIGLAAIPVLVYYKVMDPEAAALALPLLLALLNLTPEGATDET